MSDQSTAAHEDIPPLPEQDGVEYRHCVGWLGYCVGNNGSTWTCRRPGRGAGKFGDWRQLKQSLAGRGKGHWRVRLCRGGKSFYRYVHVLVLEAFVGPCPDGLQGCHNDGNRDSNGCANLRWGTQASNSQDALNHGQKPQGERHHWSTVSEDQVARLKRLLLRGLSAREAAQAVGVSRWVAVFVKAGKTWKHVQPVGGDYEEGDGNSTCQSLP